MAIAAVVALLAAVPVSAQTGATTKLEGIVTDNYGKPVEVASVILNSSLFTLTDEKGRFTFPNVPVGEIDYYVSCLGCKEVRGKASIKAAAPAKLEIKMERLSLALRGVTLKTAPKGGFETDVYE